MKNKRHFIIYLVIVFLLFILTLFFGLNYYSKKALNNEVNSILKKDISKSNFSTKTKALFSYGKVEKAIKEYMKDYSDNIKNANDIINDETIKKILSSSNFESDGPLFEKSLKYLENNKTKFNNTIDKLEKMTNKDEIMAYINKYKLSSKYISLYENYMFGNEYTKDIENNKNIINKTKEEGLKILNTDIDVLNLLKDNKDGWVIKDNSIHFYSSSLMEKYNNLVNVIKK